MQDDREYFPLDGDFYVSHNMIWTELRVTSSSGYAGDIGTYLSTKDARSLGELLLELADASEVEKD